MKVQQLLVILRLVAILATSVLAQTTIPHPEIKKLGVLGEGLAVSTTDPSDFKAIRMGLAKVSVNVAGTESELTVGILFLDDSKYAIKNIVFGNGSTSGDVYLNNSQVGSFSLNLVTRIERDVWYGTMTVNGASYNAYIVAAPRHAKSSEAADNIKDFCKEDPIKCATVAKSLKGIGNVCDKTDSESCRDKIKDFCEKNPTDKRCVFAFREYCAKHLDDHRCVSEIKQFCSKDENRDNDRCQDFCEKFTNVCNATARHPVRNATTETETENEIEDEDTNTTVQTE